MATQSKFEDLVNQKIEAEKARIRQEVVSDFLQTVPDYSITLEQFLADMKKGSMLPAVMSVSMADLASAIKRATRASGPRFDKETRERLAAEVIPQFLVKNPGSKLKDIAAVTGFEARKIKRLLADMVADGRLVQEGEKASATYSLPPSE